MIEYMPYRDKDHPGNKIRPNLKCYGCGQKGVTTAWGQWCFSCNVSRMDRIGQTILNECKRHGLVVKDTL